MGEVAINLTSLGILPASPGENSNACRTVVVGGQ
jgi:hypothetical protein